MRRFLIGWGSFLGLFFILLLQGGVYFSQAGCGKTSNASGAAAESAGFQTAPVDIPVVVSSGIDGVSPSSIAVELLDGSSGFATLSGDLIDADSCSAEKVVKTVVSGSFRDSNTTSSCAFSFSLDSSSAGVPIALVVMDGARASYPIIVTVQTDGTFEVALTNIGGILAEHPAVLNSTIAFSALDETGNPIVGTVSINGGAPAVLATTDNRVGELSYATSGSLYAADTVTGDILQVDTDGNDSVLTASAGSSFSLDPTETYLAYTGSSGGIGMINLSTAANLGEGCTASSVTTGSIDWMNSSSLVFARTVDSASRVEICNVSSLLDGSGSASSSIIALCDGDCESPFANRAGGNGAVLECADIAGISQICSVDSAGAVFGAIVTGDYQAINPRLSSNADRLIFEKEDGSDEEDLSDNEIGYVPVSVSEAGVITTDDDPTFLVAGGKPVFVPDNENEVVHLCDVSGSIQVCLLNLEHSSVSGSLSGSEGGESDGSSSSVSVSTPSLTSVRSAIHTANSIGLVQGLAMTSFVMPACTSTDSSSITYSMSGLPSWLSFNTSTLTVSISGSSTLPTSARTLEEVTYTCALGSDSSQTASLTFNVNDLDGDALSDGMEYRLGVVPLVNVAVGWIGMDPAMAALFPDLDTGILVTNVMNPNSSADASADFDGDGTTNAAEISVGTNIFVASSNAIYASSTSLTTAGTAPADLSVADFDADGDLDFVTADSTNMSVFFGNGSGSFSGRTDYSFAGSNAVTAGDFDDDGDYDFIACSFTGKQVKTYLNNGAGSFSAVSETISTAVGCDNMVAADFDEDGTLDFAVTAPGNDGSGTAIPVYLGDGDGTFTFGSSLTSSSAPMSITAADYDGDGDLDLAAGCLNFMSVFFGNGNGTFSAKTDYAVPSGGIFKGVTSADFDGDGDIDIAATSYDPANKLSIFTNNGSGTFTRTDYSTETDPRTLIAADLDGDGDIDIAMAIHTDTEDLEVFTNNGSGVFTAGAAPNFSQSGPWAIAAGDFNNDKKLDLLLSDVSGSVTGTVLVIPNP